MPTTMVEAERAAGVTNLARDWPYPEARPRKRFVSAQWKITVSPGGMTPPARRGPQATVQFRVSLR
jgi:hypothetical protein